MSDQPPYGQPPWGQPSQPEPTQPFGQQPQPGGVGQPPYGAGPGQPWQQGGMYGGEPPKKSNKGLIIGGIVAALLLIGGGITAFALTRGDDKKDETATETTKSTEPSETTEASEGADEEAYCEIMDGFEERFSGMQKMTDADIATFVTTLTEVEPIAPAEIKDEVVHVRDVFDALQKTLKDINLTFEEMQMPEKIQALSPDEQQKLVEVSKQLTDPTFQTDATAIDQDWATRC